MESDYPEGSLGRCIEELDDKIRALEIESGRNIMVKVLRIEFLYLKWKLRHERNRRLARCLTK